MDENYFDEAKTLSESEKSALAAQNSRLVPEHKANMLEIEARKHWDLFYKRNEDRFFKDRHWTTREFTELLDKNFTLKNVTVMEVGCGVGNFIFPLIEEGLDVFFIACDISPRAIDLLKKHKYYDEKKINAFQADITTEDISDKVEANSVDVATLIFVLSAIHPDKFELTVKNIYKLLKPGGLVLFRDYGLYDMAQIRFKSGHKIAENFYMRQDGTRSYYFSTEHVAKIFSNGGFNVMTCTYVHRRTVNKKENIDVPRIFVQAKFLKPRPET